MMTQSPSSLGTFLTCPRQYEAKYITKEVKFQPNDHAKFGTLIHSAIEDYLEKGAPLPTILKDLRPTLDKMRKVFIAAETKLAINKSGEPVSFFAKDAHQRCIVDAVLSNEDQSIIVCIDWKTGKKRDADVQHDFIKKCAAAKYKNANKIVTLFLYIFKGGSDRQEYTPGRELPELESHMSALAAAHAKKEFPPKPSGLCGKWCDVLSCEYNGRNE